MMFFKQLKKKNIEVRVNDVKRRKLNVGDTLIFLKKSNEDEEIRVKVTALDYYVAFELLVCNYEIERIIKIVILKHIG